MLPALSWMIVGLAWLRGADRKAEMAGAMRGFSEEECMAGLWEVVGGGGGWITLQASWVGSGCVGRAWQRWLSFLSLRSRSEG